MKQLEGHVFLAFLPKTRGKQKSLAQGGGSASMHQVAPSCRRNQSPAVNSSHRHGRTAGGDSDHLKLYAPLCSVLTIQSHHSHPCVRVWLDSNSPRPCQPQCTRTLEVVAVETACRLVHHCLVVSLLKCCPRTPKSSKAQVGTHSFCKIPVLKGICPDTFVKRRKCWFLWRQSLIDYK